MRLFGVGLVVVVVLLALVVADNNNNNNHAHIHHYQQPNRDLEASWLTKVLLIGAGLLGSGAHGFTATQNNPQLRGVVGPRPATTTMRLHKPKTTTTRAALEPQREHMSLFTDLLKSNHNNTQIKKLMNVVDVEFKHEIVAGELGAVLSDSAYVGDSSLTESLNRVAIQNSLSTFLGPGQKIEVKRVFADEATNTLMYTCEFQNGHRRAAAVVFRGTTGGLDGPNWKANLKGLFDDHNGHASGFYELYQGLRPHLPALLSTLSTQTGDAMTDYPGGVFVTGHSLGGAMATYAAIDLTNLLVSESLLVQQQPQIHTQLQMVRDWMTVLTFGQPRDMTIESANLADSILNKYRFIADGDAAPAFPPSTTFKHSGTPVYLDRIIETNGDLSVVAKSAAGDDFKDFDGSGLGGILEKFGQDGFDAIEWHKTPHYIACLDACRRKTDRRTNRFHNLPDLPR